MWNRVKEPHKPKLNPGTQLSDAQTPNPRFSSLMVRDSSGREHRRRIERLRGRGGISTRVKYISWSGAAEYLLSLSTSRSVDLFLSLDLAFSLSISIIDGLGSKQEWVVGFYFLFFRRFVFFKWGINWFFFFFF